MRLYADTAEAHAWVGLLCENHVLFDHHQGTLPRSNIESRSSIFDVAIPEPSRIRHWWNLLDVLLVRLGMALGGLDA